MAHHLRFFVLYVQQVLNNNIRTADTTIICWRSTRTTDNMTSTVARIPLTAASMETDFILAIAATDTKSTTRTTKSWRPKLTELITLTADIITRTMESTHKTHWSTTARPDIAAPARPPSTAGPAIVVIRTPTERTVITTRSTVSVRTVPINRIPSTLVNPHTPTTMRRRIPRLQPVIRLRVAIVRRTCPLIPHHLPRCILCTNRPPPLITPHRNITLHDQHIRPIHSIQWQESPTTSRHR